MNNLVSASPAWSFRSTQYAYFSWVLFLRFRANSPVILANNALLFTHVHFLTFLELLHCCAHRISSAQESDHCDHLSRSVAGATLHSVRFHWRDNDSTGNRSAGYPLTWSVVAGGGRAAETESIRREASNCWGGRKKLGTTTGSGL